MFEDSDFYMRNEIQSIKKLFKNIRDALSRYEINDIRLKIYQNVEYYNYYTSKKRLDKKQKAYLDDAINNLNELHEYLLNKTKYEDNVSYELNNLFQNSIYYKPIQIRGDFYGNYVLFESNGDNTSSLHEYLEKINVI